MNQNIIEKYDGDSHKILENIEKYEVFEIVENKEKENSSISFSDCIVKIGTESAKGFFALNEVKNVFVSSTDPKKLSSLKHGIGTAVFKDGKISEHAPFLKADIELSKVVSPFLLIQFASIALGQHFMFEINNKLGEISKDIKDIKELLEDIEISDLESSEKYLRDRQDSMTKEHVFYMETEIQNRIYRILGIFFKTIKRKLEEAKKITASGFSLTANGSVEKLKKELQKLELDKYIRIYQYAEFLLIFSMFLVWKYYISENKIEEADKTYQRILDREKELEEKFSEILEDYQQMQQQIFGEMEKIQKTSDKKAEISKILTDVTKYASYANPLLSISINSLNDKFELQKKMVDYIKDNEELFSPLRSYVENIPQRKSFMQTKQEVLYVQRDDRIFALIQKGQS